MKPIITAIVSCVFGFQVHAQVSFTLSSTLSVGQHPIGLVATNVNGDGRVDLICANNYDNTLTVLTNNGSGGFVTSGHLSCRYRAVWARGSGCQRRWLGGFDLRKRVRQLTYGVDEQRQRRVCDLRHLCCGNRPCLCRGGRRQRGWLGGFDLRELVRTTRLRC